MRRAGAGDLPGARQLLKAVIDSHMVGFYEYQMAQELAARRRQSVAQQRAHSGSHVARADRCRTGCGESTACSQRQLIVCAADDAESRVKRPGRRTP